ncbi:nucleotide exchange factor GrpE [Candidatus Methylobacter oryzae]|uniref:Protein GrpE n=1 Tax=Candidatus Methylobacter oryzae TaxID=2497749 RepID=A0ABY3CDG9_9GAMM|nr:nucleotide exchange factor GrpE [Candidatus Methylobacter oryzae]TRX00702.1 nucleotide exchange factor GrpE [Candidatus Methylobacter oryzae]
MSTDQEAPESQVKTENETVTEQPHTELVEHEPTVEELQQALAQTEQKAQENWDKAVRAQAEMENLKRRTQKDLEDAHKFALTNFAKELLPVLDSLLLGLQAATGDSEEVKKFREGSELTIKQFESVFAKFKIETIDPIGQPFNAEQHQAMAMQAVEGAVPNTVVNVFQKGYMLNGRLLRPAMVLVAKAPEKKPTDTPNIDEQA